MIEGFDPDVFEVFERFDMPKIIRDLDDRDRLPEVVKRFAALDVHPDTVSNAEMGDVFEELIRRFMEASKDVAGDYFTPREVVRLMVNLLFAPDEDDLSDPHAIRQVYDPTCGTGGMLSEAHEWLQNHGSGATLNLFGQEYPPRALHRRRSRSVRDGVCNHQVIGDAQVGHIGRHEHDVCDDLIDRDSLHLS